MLMTTMNSLRQTTPWTWLVLRGVLARLLVPANSNSTPDNTSIVLCSYEFDLTSTLVVSGLAAGGRNCNTVGTLDASLVAEVDVPVTDPADAEAGGVTTGTSSAAITLAEGTSTTQTFELNSQPNGTVTITFTSDNTSEANVSPIN